MSPADKARVFRAALGLSQEDAEWLRREVLKIAIQRDAIIGEPSRFGQKYLIDAAVSHNERTAIGANGLDH